MKVITICSSANFYKHANEIMDVLVGRGYKVVVPTTATKMRKSGDYEVSHYKTWYAKADDYAKKAELMRGHFEEVAKGDAILVVNDEKHGIAGYIGPNVLMEMGLAFYLKKPIFVLNAVHEDMPLYEEVLGVNAVILDGNFDRIKI